MEVQGYHENPVREGREKQEGYYNYFIGNDPSKYATFVGLYKEAVIKNVYEGIDVRYYFDGGKLRYDYIVHPGADPKQIVFKLEGSDKTYVDERGNLVFTTRFGEVSMSGLRVYQERDGQEVAARFVERDGGWSIWVGNYDKSQALVIDPLIYSTYIGGNGDDQGYDMAIDGSGNAYITGYTRSTDYDTTAGAYQTTFGGGNFDVFVTKLNVNGSGLVYSTYLGGSGADAGHAIAIDGSGNAYVTGSTASTDYDVTAGAYQTTYGGGYTDVFVTKLNASGSGLVYSTYLGGSGIDNGWGIAVDGSGNAYVTGWTWSTNYDTTAGAYQTTNGGGEDVFVTKLNASGSGLMYSTYLGGSGADNVWGIAVDGSGNAYVTGYTGSTNYDTTAGTYQTTHGGGKDVFVTKLNASGSGLVYSTFLGGSNDDEGYGIAVDGSGNAYVTGYTGSTNYDTTAGAYQTTFRGISDVFVTKLNASGSGLVYSTFLGGSDEEKGRGIAIDGSGNAYVTGWTKSTNFPVTVGAYQTTHSGGGYNDVFVTKIGTCMPFMLSAMALPASICAGDSSTLTALGASTYSWSTGHDTSSISVSPASTTTYTVTGTDANGCSNTASVTVTVNAIPSVSATALPDTICSGESSMLTGSGASTYSWSTGQNTSSISVTPASTTTYTVTGTATNGCSNTASVTVTVNATPTVSATALPATICAGDSSTLTATGASTYSWSTGHNTSSLSVTPTSTTTYTVTGTATNGCSNTVEVTVTVHPLPMVVASATPNPVCEGGQTTVSASGASSYVWDQGLGGGQTHDVSPSSTTTYVVTGTDVNGCTNTATVTVTVQPAIEASIAGDTVLCYGESTTLIASGGTSYEWSGAGISNPTSSQQVISPTASGVYTVTVVSGACSDVALVNVTVHPLPEVSAGDDTTIALGSSVQLHASGGVSYTWYPATGLSCTDCSDPVASPEGTTEYTVTVTDGNGCSATDEVLVRVELNCGEVFVPDAFSPNGDGKNDEFKVFGNCIKTINVKIYDRWGNKMFETSDVTESWKGDYKGKEVNAGTYVYVYSGTLVTGESIHGRGVVVLIK